MESRTDRVSLEDEAYDVYSIYNIPYKRRIILRREGTKYLQVKFLTLAPIFFE